MSCPEDVADVNCSSCFAEAVKHAAQLQIYRVLYVKVLHEVAGVPPVHAATTSFLKINTLHLPLFCCYMIIFVYFIFFKVQNKSIHIKRKCLMPAASTSLVDG